MLLHLRIARTGGSYSTTSAPTLTLAAGGRLHPLRRLYAYAYVSERTTGLWMMEWRIPSPCSFQAGQTFLS